ncbi:hypothetical protein [Pandoraea pnomenusa]|uniref:hypothetical protein n=1 Tax=Pandoraea pnomenusa TaxID=93220 RepID=UPI00333FFBDD
MADFAGENGLPVTRTWAPFLEMVFEKYTSKADLQAVADKLEDFYRHQLICSDRMVTFFHPHEKFGKQLYAKVENAEPMESAASKHFPALVPEAKLKTDVPKIPTLVGRGASPDGRVCLFYLSGRFVEEREKYKRDEVADAVREAFQDFDEFIAVKLKFRQCIDSVIVSPDGSVQLRMDLPTLTNVDYAEICIKSTLGQFHGDFSGAKGEPLVGDRVNLFNAIGNIYRTTGLGRVSELGFETPTDSVKVEKMRNKDSDLREELYHKAGKVGLKNLAEIVPYRLAVRFQSQVGKHPVELSLPGSFRELAKATQRLEMAAVSGCVLEDDFSTIVQTLLKHV